MPVDTPGLTIFLLMTDSTLHKFICFQILQESLTDQAFLLPAATFAAAARLTGVLRDAIPCLLHLTFLQTLPLLHLYCSSLPDPTPTAAAIVMMKS